MLRTFLYSQQTECILSASDIILELHMWHMELVALYSNVVHRNTLKNVTQPQLSSKNPWECMVCREGTTETEEQYAGLRQGRIWLYQK